MASSVRFRPEIPQAQCPAPAGADPHAPPCAGDSRPDAHCASSLEELACAFLDSDLSVQTRRAYGEALRPFLAFARASGITIPQPRDILAYRRLLGDQGRSCATICLALSALRRFLGFCERTSGGVFTNAAAQVRSPQLPRGFRREALTAGQARELIAAATQPRDRALLALMLTTALRSIEIQRADIGDLRNLAGHSVLFIQGKGHAAKDDFVKIPAPAERLLRAYLMTRPGAGPQAPLFASRDRRHRGERLHIKSISQLVKRALRNIGLDSPYLTAHSLRHTAATLALLEGCELQAVSQVMRHASLQTTLIYAHNLERLSSSVEHSVAQAIFNEHPESS